MLTRTNLNLPLRLTYFFLPALSRGLGVPLSTASVLVGLRSLVGMSAPLFGTLSDRWGGRRIMLLGVGLLVVGSAIIAGLPLFGAALLGFGIMGLSKSAYDPAMQAFVGQRVPYDRRARALGFAELAWSGALLGMPLCGWLIDHVDWRAPFALVGGLGLLTAWLNVRTLPPTPMTVRERREMSKPTQASLRPLGQTVVQLWRDRNARLALIITALLMLAQDNLMVVYGAWMEDRFNVNVTTLGAMTLVLGAAELLAELGVAFLSDRLGKRRAVFLGVMCTGFTYLLLPRLTGSLPAALAGTAIVILTFEFSIVGLIPIVSGMNATARGTLMSLNVTAVSLGRMVAAPLAVTLYRSGDLSRNGPASAAICMLLLVLLLLLHERGH